MNIYSPIWLLKKANCANSKSVLQNLPKNWYSTSAPSTRTIKKHLNFSKMSVLSFKQFFMRTQTEN